ANRNITPASFVGMCISGVGNIAGPYTGRSLLSRGWPLAGDGHLSGSVAPPFLSRSLIMFTTSPHWLSSSFSSTYSNISRGTADHCAHSRWNAPTLCFPSLLNSAALGSFPSFRATVAQSLNSALVGILNPVVGLPSSQARRMLVRLPKSSPYLLSRYGRHSFNLR